MCFELCFWLCQLTTSTSLSATAVDGMVSDIVANTIATDNDDDPKSKED